MMSAESLSPPALIPHVMRVLRIGFVAVNKSSEQSPKARDELFFLSLINHAERRVLNLALAATDSASFVAFSAYNKARDQQLAQPVLAARNSLTLVNAIASLENSAELQLKGIRSDMLAIEPQDLILHDVGEGVLPAPDFAARLDALRSPQGGCPAKGVVLDNFYRRYVDTIFATRPTQELE